MAGPNYTNLISYGKIALMKKQESQNTKEFMAPSLRRIKRSYLMPRKSREGEGSPSITNTKIGDKFLPQIIRNKRRRILVDSVRDHLVLQISEKTTTRKMFKTLKKLFEHNSINMTLTSKE